MRSEDPRMLRLVDYFERLSPADLPGMGQHYSDTAFFKDPFNEVRGLPAVQAIFAHMFETLEAPRFIVRDSLVEGSQGFLSWDFEFRLKGQSRQRQIHGSSHLRFAPDGRVEYHRDYWDAAEQVWEQVPLLGALLRWLRRRLQA